MRHVPPQIPPSHNKSEEDGASLSFHLLAAQKAAAAAIITLILILPLLKLRSSKFDSFNFSFLALLEDRSRQTRRRNSDIREVLRGDQTLLRIKPSWLRCFCLCQARPAPRRPPGAPARRHPEGFQLPSSPGAWAAETAAGPSLGAVGRKPPKTELILSKQQRFSPGSIEM